MGIASESRTAKRFPIQSPVDLRVAGRSAAFGQAVNISAGGLLVIPGDLLPVGSPCEVAVMLPVDTGMGVVVEEGTVVRSGEGGTAIRFIRSLGEMALRFLANPASLRPERSWLYLYMAYFRVGQGNDEFECRRAFGISRRTFRQVTTLSFFACIACALLAVWLARGWIAGLAGWTKAAGALVYGACWLFVLQPLVDILVIRFLGRGRHRA